LDNKFEPLKVAWINHAHNLFVFVNRDGVKKLELKADNLAEMIREGKANPTDSLDTPIMDRATYLMLQKLHEKLIFNATHDSTTHLLNQKEFITQLKRELTNLDNAKYLLCNIEIQDFRTITNACGVSGVEALLKQLANLLKQYVNKDDLYARINDRTFSVLLKNCSAEVAKELHLKFISSEFKWQDKNYAVAASMGIVPLFSENSYEINTVLQNVDSANLSAMSAGRNCIRVYKDNDESLKSQFNARDWVGRINQVLAENRLFLRCQKIDAINPKINSHSDYEILLGINDEKNNVI
jgi:diguanylate cyclase (GGDEF)-like protein